MTSINSESDLANIKQRAKYIRIYEVNNSAGDSFVILPIYGKGYASTIYGFIGIDITANSVIGLSFYEHDETPGLGANLSKPAWLSQWQGKKIWDESGALRIGVSNRPVSPSHSDAIFLVDGISGATWTSRGIDQLVRYWLGDHGFGPYLKKQRSMTR